MWQKFGEAGVGQCRQTLQHITQVGARPRLSIMPSDSRASALHDLWSIVLAKVTTGNKAPTEWSHACDAARGEQLLAAPSRLSSRQAHTIVKLGISSRCLTLLSKYLGLSKGAVAGYLDLDCAAATRKEAEDEMLPAYAAESLLRLLELDGLAKQTFETSEEAAGWMRQPHPMLDGESPLECAKSSFGAQRVKDILVAILHGGVV